MGQRRGGPLRTRRILAAQLDGSQQRLKGMRINKASPEVFEQQRQRIASLRAEIADHEATHGAPPETGRSGGLWGDAGPARQGDDLYSSGSHAP